MTGTDKFQLVRGEAGEAEKQRGNAVEENANVRPDNPGNEAPTCAGETQLRDS